MRLTLLCIAELAVEKLQNLVQLKKHNPIINTESFWNYGVQTILRFSRKCKK